MTFRQKLLLGVALLILPAVIIGLGAIHSNALQRKAIGALESRLARSRTYAELETAMFDQSTMIWQILAGVDASAVREIPLRRQVVTYRFERWKAELDSQDLGLADQVTRIQQGYERLTDSVVALVTAGRRPDGYRLARAELSAGLEPAFTELNRLIYRRARESTVAGTFENVSDIFARQQRFLAVVLVVSTLAALVAAGLLTRSLVRPLNQLRDAIATVGAGDLDHPIRSDAPDEIGDLARAFAGMTVRLRESRAELVRLNEELAGKVRQVEQAQARLIQSEKLASLGQVATGVAHGLRNPLAGIRASAQLLARHPSSPQAPEHLSALIGEVDRLDRRITHLLDFARPTSPHVTTDRVLTLVEEVLPAFAERSRAQRVTIEVRIPGALPAVRMDSLRTEQALVEVISNALDAMPGGGTLSITAEAVNRDGDGAGVTLTLTDTGPGIPESALASVGQPFFTTKPEGTGLGVASARRFIEQSGGRMDISSAAPGGTRVTVWLPAAT